MQLAYSTNFANGIYNSRVDCSYEVLNIDRSTAYLNGVHFKTDIGDTMIGKAMAPYINKNRIGGEKITWNWFVNTVPTWSSIAACWTRTGTKLTSNGGSGLLRKDTFWTIGKRYKITTKVIHNSGNLYLSYDVK